MSKQMLFGAEARKNIQIGACKLANAVKITLGPRGRNVVLEKQYQQPLITNDGVTIAKEVVLENDFENVGAELIKEVSIKTNDVAGDGTTTACVLAEAMLKEGNKNCEAGANPIILRKGMQKALNVCVDELKKLAKKVETSKEIEQVASISAGDSEIGKLIANAMEQVGTDGVITIEESGALETTLNVIEGMQFERGYLSPYMCTNTEKMFVEFENPYILITDKKISSIQEILPLLEMIVQSGQKLLIVADDVENEVLATIVLNKLRGTFNCVAVKAPSFGDNRKNCLEDLALLCGGKVVSEDVGLSLQTTSMADLGRAKTINVTKDSTTIVGGCGDKKQIEKRIEIIREQIANCKDNYEKEHLKERLAKLAGGVAVINVGSATEIEMKEKKLRIEDALSATKSATEEGVVVGGGVALLKTKQALEKLIEKLDDDEKTGAKIVLKSLEAPIRQIAENCGFDGSVVVLKILEKIGDESFGFDALNLKYCDMFQSGIIDPAKVTRTALENAVSIASSILTTECVVVENKIKNIEK